MALKEIYLLNPYTDIIKVNVIGDSEFKLYLNGAIHYTIAEVIAKINSVPHIGDGEDEITRIARWISCIQANIIGRQNSAIDSGNIIANLNSYSDMGCTNIACLVYNVFSLFYPDDYCSTVDGLTTGVMGHSWNAFTDGLFDQINKLPFYKGKYTMPTLAEVHADGTFYYEPLRSLVSTHQTKDAYNGYFKGDVPAAHYNPLEIICPLDNFKMKMPNGSSFVFPVKSANTLKDEVGDDIPLFAAMICSFPAGVTGVVEMPCNVYQVTGAGVISIGGTSYTLPADEAAVKTKLQETTLGEGYYTTNTNFLNTFTIISNAGGIECEYLVNRKTWLLYHNNTVEYIMTSGSLTFERAKAAIPLDTIILSVDKGDAPSFTLNFDKWFTTNKSFKLPVPSSIHDQRIVTFSKDENGKNPIPQYFDNYTKDTTTAITAGANVIDQCFAARLTPKDETFASTLELTFTAVDGSSTYYTLDGSTPDATKTLYTEPFTISATTTVKWINIREGYANSHVNTRVITKTA